MERLHIYAKYDKLWVTVSLLFKHLECMCKLVHG